ncbi:hypothetical protein ACSYAF_02405 [Edwardsiella tarda]|uniref:hypothetical protein n=1 Tax=Edwardsiella tarda TaxID=636 RepID=UPI00266FE384|nr:hypothetical protein [Edwardsiella tarda]WKS81700.1 hypothetical protein NHU85_02455 [Edwardsiella tarda]
MNKYQHLFLYAAIVSALYNTAWASNACASNPDLLSCQQIIIGSSGAKIQNENIKVSQQQPIILMEQGTTLTKTQYITSSTIINESSSAIKFNGSFEKTSENKDTWLSIKSKSYIKGKDVAIDFSDATGPARAEIDNSHIVGNILGNGNKDKTNKINFKGVSIFDGTEIVGFNSVE